MMQLVALLIGCLLDGLFGDPPGLPHLVVLIGRLVGFSERRLRRLLPATNRGQFRAGLILAIGLPLFCCAAVWGLLLAANLVSPWLRLALESLVCWQCLALRALRDESETVRRALVRNDLPAARQAVSRIVGRDTGQLDAAGVTRAAVETVAENTSDGIIAPLLFMAIGTPLAVWYKAVNTLDSMVGYKNETYRFFGKASARLDDAANFLPARLAGLLMIIAASLVGLNGKKAWQIFRRDRLNHASPNSAQTEAACAGALGIRLGGTASYFGQTVAKPTIGDADRAAEPADISRAHHLMIGASLLCLVLVVLVRGVIAWL